MKYKSKNAILFLAVLLLLTIHALYWGTKKEGFHGDELYSYHFISVVDYPSINADRAEKEYLNNWHKGSYFTDYLTVSSEEAFDVAGVFNSIKEDVHPPVFYILLELSCSLFSQNLFSKWSGIFLNLLFFMLTIMSLYWLSKKILKSSNWALLACAAYGASAGAVSTVVYIRMYMILTFASVVFLCIQAAMWDKIKSCVDEPIKKRIILYIFMLTASIFGILTHYYFVVFAFFVCFIFWLYLLFGKKFKMAVEYTVFMGGSLVLSLFIWPDLYNDVFSGYRGTEAQAKFIESRELLTQLRSYVNVVNNEILGGYGKHLILILLILLFIGILKCFFGIKIYSSIGTGFSISAEIKSQKPLKQKYDLEFGKSHMFIIQLAAAAICYIWLIGIIAPLQSDRYIFNVYPAVILLIIFFIKEIIDKASYGRIGKTVAVGVLLVMVFMGYKNTGVEYLYRGTAENLETIVSRSEYPVIFLAKSNRRYVSSVASIYLEKSAEVYVIDQDGVDSLDTAMKEYKDEEMIVYIDTAVDHVDAALQNIMEKLNMKSSQFLFTTGESNVYLID